MACDIRSAFTCMDSPAVHVSLKELNRQSDSVLGERTELNDRVVPGAE